MEQNIYKLNVLMTTEIINDALNNNNINEQQQ